MKFEEGKPDPGLFYTSALYETVQVRAFGIKKHGSEIGWKTTKPIQHYNAAIRHIRAVIDGEDYDDESKKLHLAHAICDCMFEIERFKNPDTKLTSVKEKTIMLKEHEEKIRLESEIIGGFKK